MNQHNNLKHSHHVLFYVYIDAKRVRSFDNITNAVSLDHVGLSPSCTTVTSQDLTKKLLIRKRIDLP